MTWGIAVGLGAAILGAQLLSSRGVRSGFEPNDPAAGASAVACLLLVALVTCAVPAARALRVDPVEVVRVE